MAKNNYTIVGDYSSPTKYETESNNFNTVISEETAMNFLLMMHSIIDEQIEKRIKDGQDIARVYTAEITGKTVTSVVIGSVVIGNSTYNTTTDRLTAITVRYNDEDYVDISNDSVQILSADDRWIKICTYDGVNFFVLHKM